MQILFAQVGTARCAVRSEFLLDSILSQTTIRGRRSAASLPSGFRLSRKRPRVIFFENIQHETTSAQVLAVKSLELGLKISRDIGTVSPFRKLESLG
jgi:hypothetical protein